MRPGNFGFLTLTVWLRKEKFTTEDLREAILHVLNDPAFSPAMVNVQRAVAAAGGVARAADLIEAQARPSSSSR
jgi:UDP:flavonoid glycosyltransferase YjiC (YdhE family)